MLSTRKWAHCLIDNNVLLQQALYTLWAPRFGACLFKASSTDVVGQLSQAWAGTTRSVYTFALLDFAAT